MTSQDETSLQNNTNRYIETSDNGIERSITVSYEHDVGVIEITQPEWHDLWPGTYPVEGIIQNFGVAYAEYDIPVNANFKSMSTGDIIYNETIIVPGPLDPGQSIITTFPDVTFPNLEDHYKLSMKTLLPGDDHPENDIKTKVYDVGYHWIPPETHAHLSGTMGNNGWYVSCVTVTLSVIEDKWPPGVDYTMYKVDDGAWEVYEAPIIVCPDGPHTVYFYSVYTTGQVEEIKSISFKIDQTAPSIALSVEDAGFRKWRFIANASDQTSGLCLVEFYIDDMLLGNITAPGPYEWNWTGKGNHTVTGFAYDYAGNSAENHVVFSYTFSNDRHQRFPLLSLLETIIQMLLTHHPLATILAKLLNSTR